MTSTLCDLLATLQFEQTNPVFSNVAQNIDDWCKENNEGYLILNLLYIGKLPITNHFTFLFISLRFFIKDLDFIYQVIEILIHHLVTDYNQISPVLDSFLEICAKVCIANQRKYYTYLISKNIFSR